MARLSTIRLTAASLCVALFAASPAVAKWEADSQEAGIAGQAVTVACDVSDDAIVTEVCTDVLMRWRLCERGFVAERLSTAGLYACFIN